MVDTAVILTDGGFFTDSAFNRQRFVFPAADFVGGYGKCGGTGKLTEQQEDEHDGNEGQMMFFQHEIDSKAEINNK